MSLTGAALDAWFGHTHLFDAVLVKPYTTSRTVCIPLLTSTRQPHTHRCNHVKQRCGGRRGAPSAARAATFSVVACVQRLQPRRGDNEEVPVWRAALLQL